MNNDEKIRAKAYEIWERDGRTGNPEDHWHQAEREIRVETSGTETSQPAEAVTAVEMVDAGPTQRRSKK